MALRVGRISEEGVGLEDSTAKFISERLPQAQTRTRNGASSHSWLYCFEPQIMVGVLTAVT